MDTHKIHGLQHIGFAVANIDEAVGFFIKSFGAKVILECDPIDLDDDFAVKRLGVPAGCRIEKQVVLQVGKGGALELFEYSGEDASTSIKRNSQVGGWHIAFEVEDVYETAKVLHSLNVDLLEGPSTIEEGPMAGLSWLYLKSPWGQNLEVLSLKRPLGYEVEGNNSNQAKMYSPKDD